LGFISRSGMQGTAGFLEAPIQTSVSLIVSWRKTIRKAIDYTGTLLSNLLVGPNDMDVAI
jgi:hypothetical protein